MDMQAREKIKLHRTNLFRPIGQGISHIAINQLVDLIAVAKHHTTRSCKIDQSLTIIDILEISKKGCPIYLDQLIEYANVKGIAWTGIRLLLTVSYEKDIKIYDISSGREIFSLITDYGPIISLKYSHEHRLLLTGTTLGSVVAYRVDPTGRSVEFYRHLTRTNDQIQSLDFTFQKKVAPEKKKAAKKVSPKKRHSPLTAGKRKRPISQDSDEDDSEEEEEAKEPDEFEGMIVYGTVQGRITAWEFTKGTIIDSFLAVGQKDSLCSSLLTLDDGRIVTGDTSGTVSIYDNKSFTCLQTFKLSDQAILCLAKNLKKSSIIASGMDPTVVVLKKEESDGKSYNLFEKNVSHLCPLSCARFSSRKEFYTGGLDGLLIRHEISKDHNRKRKHTFETLPNYSNNISVSQGEMMFQKLKSIEVWQHPKSNQNTDHKNKIDLVSRTLNIKAKSFIHCSTFSDKWICLSTRKAFHIYERARGQFVEMACDLDPKLSGRRSMILCCDNRCLVAGVGDRLYILQLTSDADGDREQAGTNGVGDPGEGASCKVVAEFNVKGTIRQLLYMPSVKQLVVLSGLPAIYLTCFSLKANPGVAAAPCGKGTLKYPALFVAHNLSDPNEDKNLYIYTIRNQLAALRLSKSKSCIDKSLSALSQSESISGLPADIAPAGMLIINPERCLLYDDQKLYDIDLSENRVVEPSEERARPDFRYIAKTCALIEDGHLEYLIMVQIPPEDYQSSLPRLRSISLMPNGKDRSIGSSSGT